MVGPPYLTYASATIWAAPALAALRTKKRLAQLRYSQLPKAQNTQGVCSRILVLVCLGSLGIIVSACFLNPVGCLSKDGMNLLFLGAI